MGRVASLISKVDRAMRDLNVTDRVVYKRLLSREGGDPLIGRGQSVTLSDTQLDPQPIVEVPTSDNPLLLSGVVLNPATDYLLSISASAMSLSELKNPNYLVVFQNAEDDYEECTVVRYIPVVLEGTVVMYSVLVRSRKR
jgi:hypothetical protein